MYHNKILYVSASLEELLSAPRRERFHTMLSPGAGHTHFERYQSRWTINGLLARNSLRRLIFRILHTVVSVRNLRAHTAVGYTFTPDGASYRSNGILFRWHKQSHTIDKFMPAAILPPMGVVFAGALAYSITVC